MNISLIIDRNFCPALFFDTWIAWQKVTTQFVFNLVKADMGIDLINEGEIPLFT